MNARLAALVVVLDSATKANNRRCATPNCGLLLVPGITAIIVLLGALLTIALVRRKNKTAS